MRLANYYNVWCCVFFLFPVKPVKKRRVFTSVCSYQQPERRTGNCCSCTYSAVAHFQSTTESAFWLRPTLGKTWSDREENTLTNACCMATRFFWMRIQWHSVPRLKKNSTMHLQQFLLGFNFQWNLTNKQKTTNVASLKRNKCFVALFFKEKKIKSNKQID